MLTISDIQKMRKRVTNRPAQQKILKDVLRMKENESRQKQNIRHKNEEHQKR